MSRETKLIVDQLIHDLQNRPKDFQCYTFELHDNKTGFSYWVSEHGEKGMHKPFKLSFGFIQSIRFIKALNKWKACNMIELSQLQKG